MDVTGKMAVTANLQLHERPLLIDLTVAEMADGKPVGAPFEGTTIFGATGGPS